MKNLGYNKHKQNGAILIVALVFLMVLTILSLSSVSNSSLETRMAYNERQSQISHEASEAALRAGANWVTTAGNIDTAADLSKFGYGTSVKGLYQAVPFDANGTVNSAPATLITEDGGWVCSGTDQNAIEVTGQLDGSLPRAPCFYLEYVGRTKLSDNGVIHSLQKLDYNDGVDLNSLKEAVFEITAVGWGYDTNAYSILRTNIRKQLD
ncbi:MAG: hypothetical protein GY703_20070 [Gammaproteobacteria bacterium]|nr:hypothetical protein [Gammaproteobacteria bacterium]